MTSKLNYSEESENALNTQISLELQASHNYLYLSSYFGRDLVSLPGLRSFFLKQSEEEREHALKMIEYQNCRGGKVRLAGIKSPEFEVISAKQAVEIALQMEKDNNKSLLSLHEIASKNNDPQFSDFLESEFLEEQVESIKQLSDMLTNLHRAGDDGLGLYLFDKDLSK